MIELKSYILQMPDISPKIFFSAIVFMVQLLRNYWWEVYQNFISHWSELCTIEIYKDFNWFEPSFYLEHIFIISLWISIAPATYGTFHKPLF